MDMTGYSFIIDIDGTICPIKKSDEKYEELVPYPEMVNRIRDLHSSGAYIVLFTSRNMKSYGGNLGKINKYTAKTILEWLGKWDIPFDEIIYGKPWPGEKGFYVDDRTIRPDEFISCSPEEMEEICSKSRMKR